MSNIIKFAPYVYLAKRGGGTVYDLLLLVPVDASGDTNLSNVTAVKPGGTRITIDYTTTGTAANAPYRFKHWVIDSEGTYLDIEIQGDNNADRTIIVAFADADTEPATVSSQVQTCAPYLFAKVETVGTDIFVRPSCIILFDNGLGVQSESIVFETNGCKPTFTLGNSSATTLPTKFVINQDIKIEMVANGQYTFEGNVAENNSYNKPPRKHKVKVYW